MRFRVSKYEFDPSLGDNREIMDNFVESVRQAVATSGLERIEITGSASPEGESGKNDQLAKNRCSSIAEYIISHTGVTRNLIEEHPIGVNWSELRRLVSENPSVPRKTEVLRILDNTPVWIYNSRGQVIDGRKKRLMDLDGGRPWDWMLLHLFPKLRNAVAISLYRSPSVKEDSRSEGESGIIDPEVATADKEGDSQDKGASASQDEGFGPAEIVKGTDASQEGDKERDSHIPSYRFALKTNLLYDAILMPNLELEYLIDKHWSVALEANVAWWNKSIEKTYRIALGTPEVRYHIKPRDEWHGMYAGVFAGGGFYDLCGRGKGYRGPAVMAGVSFGYMWPITRRLSLEAGIGVGYMYSRYKHYIPLDGHKVYVHTRDLHFFGPLKLKFSLAWRFYDINRKKRISETK